MTKIIKKPGYWTILMLIPYVNYVFLVWTYNRLAKSFGKDTGFTIGLVFLSIVFFPILAFGDAQYLWGDGEVIADETLLDGELASE